MVLIIKIKRDGADARKVARSTVSNGKVRGELQIISGIPSVKCSLYVSESIARGRVLNKQAVARIQDICNQLRKVQRGRSLDIAVYCGR